MSASFVWAIVSETWVDDGQGGEYRGDPHVSTVFANHADAVAHLRSRDGIDTLTCWHFGQEPDWDRRCPEHRAQNSWPKWVVPAVGDEFRDASVGKVWIYTADGWQ